MEGSEKRIQESVRSILEIKSHVDAELTVAGTFSTWLGPEGEFFRAQETTKQGRTLMIFTIVTIVFVSRALLQYRIILTCIMSAANGLSSNAVYDKYFILPA